MRRARWPSLARARRPRRVRACSRAGAGDDAGGREYWVELDNAFGLIEGGDLKIAGVRAGKITRARARPRAPTARSSASRSPRRASARCAPTSRCEVAPAVADRRVLRRLPAGHRRKPSCAEGARIPVEQTALDGRARPRQQHPAPPLPRAPEHHRQRARRRRRRQRARTSTTRSGARRPALRETDRSWRSSAEQNQRAGRPRPRRRHRRRRPRRQPQGRRPLGRRGARHRGRVGRAPATTSPRASAACPASCASCARRWRRSGGVADAQTPALRDLARLAPTQLERLFEQPRRRSPTRRGPAFRALGEASRRPAAAPCRPRAPGRRAARAASPGARRSSARTSRSSSSTSTTASTPSRTTRAAPGGKGYTGLEALLHLRLRPDAVDEHLRLERSTPQGRRCSPSRRARTTPTSSASSASSSEECAARARARTSRASTSPTRRSAGDDRDARRRTAPDRPRQPPTRRRAPPASASRAPAAPEPAAPPARADTRILPAATSRRASSTSAALPAACPTSRGLRERRAARAQAPSDSLLDYLLGDDEAPRQASIVANPVLVGRGHDARRRRRRLPGLQRQQRPAVRADARSSRSRSPTARTSCSGNEVRSGGFRIGVVEDMEPVRLPDGHGRRAS